MIRRNLLALSASVVAAALLITGCKKDANEVSENSVVFSVAQAKQWYANNASAKQNNLNSQSRKKIGNFSPLWDKAFNSNDDKYEIVETPLKFDHNPGFSSSPDPAKSKVNGITRMLILKNKKSGDIQSALMHVFSNSGTEEKNMTYSKGKENFTGTVFFTDLDGNFVNGWQYEKGKIIRKGDKEVSSNNASSKLPAPGEGECQILEIIWYERDCQEVTYNSGVYTCGPWQYLSATYVTYCLPTGGGGDGGGSYGGGDSGSDCNKTGPVNLKKLAYASAISNETKSITTLEELAETRTKKYEWIILKNIGWYLFSWEKGVHIKKVNTIPSLQWEWQSLEHLGISKVGISIGGSVDYSLISAIPTIGKYNAIMDVDFGVTYSVVCSGSPFSGTYVYNSNKNFNIND